jgi:YVTN family beta-propeller protein
MLTYARHILFWQSGLVPPGEGVTVQQTRGKPASPAQSKVEVAMKGKLLLGIGLLVLVALMTGASIAQGPKPQGNVSSQGMHNQAALPALAPQEQNVHAQPTVTATVSVNNPHGVGVNRSTNRIYISRWTDSALAVIDGATNQVITNCTSSGTGVGVDVNAVTNRVYVSGWSDLSVHDGSNCTRIATINTSGPAGGTGAVAGPVAVNPNTNRIYVAAGHGGNNLLVVDGDSNTISATIGGFNGGWGLGVNPNTNRIYASRRDHNDVQVIDGATNTIAVTISVGLNPYGLAVDPNANRIYVANYDSKNVSVINGDTNMVDATIELSNSPISVAVNPDINRIYVADAANTVWVIDGATLMVEAVVGVGSGVQADGIDVNPNTNRVYVANSSSGTVSIIDDSPVPPTAIGSSCGAVTIPLHTDDPFAVAYNPVNDYLYVLRTGVTNPQAAVLRYGHEVTRINFSSVGYQELTSVGVNPHSGLTFVTRWGDDRVYCIIGTQIVSSYSTGYWGPAGVWPSTLTSDTYVSGKWYQGTGKVAHFTGCEFRGLVDVGSDPNAGVVAENNQHLYLANSNSDTVSVVAGGSLSATINVGDHPNGIAYNPVKARFRPLVIQRWWQLLHWGWVITMTWVSTPRTQSPSGATSTLVPPIL